MASNSNKDVTLKQLFDTRWFFGEISEESAKAILIEASENDGRTVKRMIFLKQTMKTTPLGLPTNPGTPNMKRKMLETKTTNL